MKFKTATYKRVKNLGNYQTETLELTIEIHENESADNAIKALTRKVNDHLYPPDDAIEPIY